MEIASPSSVMEQPDRESDSPDASYASSSAQEPPVDELQEAVSVEITHYREETQTEPLSDKFESLLSALQTSLFDLRDSPAQIRLGLEIWWTLLGRTRRLLEDAENRVLYSVSVTLWLADVMEVLNDMEDILDKIMEANRSRLTAEDQSSANKPWKFILNLFNKVPRFMHGPDREMASEVGDITNRLELILGEANRLGLIARLDTEDKAGTLISILPKFLVKKIYDLRLMDTTAHEIMHFICPRLSTLNKNQLVQSGVHRATFEAIKNGNPEIVIEITKANTNILSPENFGKLFAYAVRHRQEELVQFLYGCNARIGTNIVFDAKLYGDNLLHSAARLAPPSHLDSISGAALQLQSELRWFKAVEGIVPQFFNYQKNGDDKTPSQVFVNEHKQLLKDAEEWMKKVAESSTAVGALIITITFAVAFTVPGGNDQNTGFPIFLSKTADSSTVPSPAVLFMVFVASDAISLFAAFSSVLMFLEILTSRYVYEDFLKSLPKKLIIGISSLFISIAAMMVAFCVALFIMLQGRLWMIIPVTLLAGIPVIIFVRLLIHFLLEFYASTFRPGIFDRKKNINIGKGRDG